MAYLLIVDDEEMLLTAMDIILSDDGHQVQTVTSAIAALSALEKKRPDLIISDVMMPRMSGIQLLTAARTRYTQPDIPFLFVTANTTPELRQQVSQHDTIAFLYKPFDADQLSRTVARILHIDD